MESSSFALVNTSSQSDSNTVHPWIQSQSCGCEPTQSEEKLAANPSSQHRMLIVSTSVLLSSQSCSRVSIWAFLVIQEGFSFTEPCLLSTSYFQKQHFRFEEACYSHTPKYFHWARGSLSSTTKHPQLLPLKISGNSGPKMETSELTDDLIKFMAIIIHFRMAWIQLNLLSLGICMVEVNSPIDHF